MPNSYSWVLVEYSGPGSSERIVNCKVYKAVDDYDDVVTKFMDDMVQQAAWIKGELGDNVPMEKLSDKMESWFEAQTNCHICKNGMARGATCHFMPAEGIEDLFVTNVSPKMPSKMTSFSNIDWTGKVDR